MSTAHDRSQRTTEAMEGLKDRCGWCKGSELYEDYHDNEWGRPVRDERKMFEFLLLETFQAGLSGITVLKKREAFRAVFHQFEIAKVAKMTHGLLMIKMIVSLLSLLIGCGNVYRHCLVRAC